MKDRCPNLPDRECLRCGKSFHPQNGRQIYCSATCRKEHTYKVSSESRFARVCIVCGKAISTNGNGRLHSKYCSLECRRAGYSMGLSRTKSKLENVLDFFNLIEECKQKF